MYHAGSNIFGLQEKSYLVPVAVFAVRSIIEIAQRKKDCSFAVQLRGG